jgi:hypothetical protein
LVLIGGCQSPASSSGSGSSSVNRPGDKAITQFKLIYDEVPAHAVLGAINESVHTISVAVNPTVVRVAEHRGIPVVVHSCPEQDGCQLAEAVDIFIETKAGYRTVLGAHSCPQGHGAGSSYPDASASGDVNAIERHQDGV